MARRYNAPMITTDKVTALLSMPQQWQVASWDDYVALRDIDADGRIRLFFDEGWLWFEMGEGIQHAGFSDLFIMIFAFWKQRHPDFNFHSLGRCQLEKMNHQACAPDLVLYVGDISEGAPQWEPGRRRYVNLDRLRIPDLVGEVSDTTLATDLDEKKRLYASLRIPEYWVIDIRGRQVLAFQLRETGSYQLCQFSGVLQGLSIALLEQTVERLATESNTDAALWFAQQIADGQRGQD